jgi:hypothetical protein
VLLLDRGEAYDDAYMLNNRIYESNTYIYTHTHTYIYIYIIYTSLQYVLYFLHANNNNNNNGDNRCMLTNNKIKHNKNHKNKHVQQRSHG